MLRRPTNRIRPSLDALEVREVCFAGVALGMMPPVLGPLPPIGPIRPAVDVGALRPGAVTDPVVKGELTRPGPHLNRLDSVITLRNETATAIRFSVRWAGAAQATQYILAPGESQRVTFRQVEVFRANVSAVILYAPDQGRAAVRKAQVVSGVAAVGPDGTSVGDGRVYSFRSGPTGGVGLYPATRLRPTGA